MFKKYFTIVFVLLLSGLGQLANATTYTTTGNNSWSPSTPGNNLNSSDDFVINHKVTLNGLRLLNGGSITVNTGGELTFAWSVRFDLGSTIHVKPGGKMTIKQLTAANYSSNFVIDGDIITKNGTLANYQSGIITYNQGGSWQFNQMSFVNYGTLIMNEDADWKNGSVSFSLGTAIINGKVSIKNMNLANNATIEGVGQIEVKNGNGSFTSAGEINGCMGNGCIPPSTIGSTTYLAYHSATSGNTFTTYEGGNVPNTSCSTTLQVLEDVTFNADKTIGDLIVSPGVNITVNPGVSVTVCAGILSEGIVTVENTGSLVQTSTANKNEGSGLYVVKRIGGNSPLAYNSWSSPINDASLAEVFGNANPCDMFCFDGATQNWVFDYPVNYQTSCNGNQVTFGSNYVFAGADGNMDQGRGYFIPGHNITLRTFEGNVNNGDVVIPVYETSVGNNPNWNLDDWNLLGNPYPSAIDLDVFFAQNNQVVTGDFYFWVDDNSNGNTYNQSDDYAVINDFTSIAANGSADPTKYVSAGQGFWVYALQDGNVTFSNSMRVSGNNNMFFKSDASDEKAVVRINLENDSNNFNQTAIGFSNTSTNGYDMAMDAPKGESGAALMFGSLIDTNVYSIQAFEKIADFDAHTTPLYVETLNVGNHTFSIDSLENVGSHLLVYLKDNTTGTTIDLKAQNYVVNLPAGKYTDRFELIMVNTGLPNGVEELANSGSNVHVFQNMNTIRVQTNDVNKSMKAVTVISVVGQMMVENLNLNNTSLEIDGSSLNSGAYLIKVEYVDGQVETKKIVFVKS